MNTLKNCLFISTTLSLLFLSSPGFTSDSKVSIEDSRSTVSFEKTPERAVALSWSLIEQLIEISVPPVGVADVQGYTDWVAHPALPKNVVDVGTRSEPNVEVIAELVPDVILISDDQLDFADVLERVAPVIHFDSFNESHDNAAFA
ncbi:MAG: ABC transporter substrate-binding protein, partial [Pseudomonadota bacterium]